MGSSMSSDTFSRDHGAVEAATGVSPVSAHIFEYRPPGKDFRAVAVGVGRDQALAAALAAFLNARTSPSDFASTTSATLRREPSSP